MSAVAHYSKLDILGLYRSCLRYSHKFENYNFREYFLRKTKNTFRVNSQIEDPAKIEEFMSSGKKDLLLLKRQSTISQMYHFDKLVVEKL